MEIRLIGYPSDEDWIQVKARALVTVGKEAKTVPDSSWKKRILEARHSPIRYLRYSFYIKDIPSWVATHLARHVHAQPYIRSQRNDRQNEYDRNAARQDAPVDMIYDVNAEELMVIANKRLCNQASEETRNVVRMMCDEAVKVTPELKELLVPACIYQNGACHEMFPCYKNSIKEENMKKVEDGSEYVEFCSECKISYEPG